MSRKKQFMYNTLTGIIKQAVTVICGFILPRYMLLYYGSSVNGLVSAIAHYLSFISLLDMGVGAVVQSNLYKPLAEKNTEQISKIVKSSSRFFTKLACIFLLYIGILFFIFPRINNEFSTLFTISLLIIIAISSFAQYLFGMTNQLLLNADQKSYVHLSMQIVTILLNTVFSIYMMTKGATIHQVKLMTSLVFVLRPIGQYLFVRKKYRIIKNVQYDEEPIKQKWNGFSQHIAAVICQNIDVVVLTLFKTLKDVSVYSVYYNIVYGVQQIVMTAATGLEALFGNMLAKNEKQKLFDTFCVVEWVVHNAISVIFSAAAIMIIPFVSIYTKGITDINYIIPSFGIILVLAYGIQCLRIPYFRLIKAAGHYKETQNGAYISAVLNIILTICLVFKMGLIGAAIGTFVAMLYHTCYFAFYLRKHIIFRKISFFIKYMITDTLISGISYVLCSYLSKNDLNGYSSWFVEAIKNLFIISLVMIIVNIVLYRKEIRLLFKYVKFTRKERT